MKKILISIVLSAVGLIAFDMLLPQQAAQAGLGFERWRNGLSSESVQIGDMTIHYNTGGKGEPLVLIHGFGADKDNWTRVAGYLTGQYQIFAIDLPGFGDSSRIADADFHIDSQVARLHEILQGLNLSGFHMGGSSMGGFISLQYAATFPDEVRSIWVLAPGGIGGAQTSELRGIFQNTGHNPLIVKRAEDFPSIMQFTMSQPPLLPFSIKQTLGERAARDYELHKRIFGEINQSPPVNELVRGSQIPTLIVWGEQDRALHVSGARILETLLPASERIVRPSIGHLPMIEEPKRTANDWLTFQGRQH